MDKLYKCLSDLNQFSTVKSNFLRRPICGFLYLAIIFIIMGGTIYAGETPVPSFPKYSTYVYREALAGVDNFLFFVDPDPEGEFIANLTEESFNLMCEQFQAAYNYFIVERGFYLEPDVVEIYLSNEAAAARDNQGFIRMPLKWMSPDFLDFQYTVPAHELFHMIQSSMITHLGVYEVLLEATATLAQQMPSANHFIRSIDDDPDMNDPSYADGLYRTYFFDAYRLNLFYRYVFEQIKGNPGGVGDLPLEERYGYATEYLYDFIGLWAGLSTSNPDVNPTADDFFPLLDELIRTRHTSNSTANSVEEAIQNYMTAVYAFRFVSADDYPQYSFVNADSYRSIYENLDYVSAGSRIDGQTLINLNNEKQYRYWLPFYGFNCPLTAEYHQFDLDKFLSSITFERTPTCGDLIGFQLILRYADNIIEPFNVLEMSDLQVLAIPRDREIIDAVFVAYTVDPTPYRAAPPPYPETDHGTTFNVNLTGQPISAGFENAPVADNASSITMKAGLPAQIEGVQYYFEETTGGGNDSGWQDSPEYTDSGLSANTQYGYRVRARDVSNVENVTGWSGVAYATTERSFGGCGN